MPTYRSVPLLFCALGSMLIPFNALAGDHPLSPQNALAAFRLEPNLRIELVAAEPMVVDPVAIAFDEKGRMYVAEDRGYPTGPGKGQPPAGRIALLEDTDNDGKFDKRSEYAEGLSFPNGIQCWRGGIFVTCAPDVFYFKDGDGDGKAEFKKVVFTGFQHLSTTQLRVSHPTLSIDNWIYMNCGLTASKVLAKDCPNREVLSINRLDFRFRPDTCEYEEVSGTGQFGGTFDAFGRRFICSNRNHNQHVVMQGKYLRRNPHLSFSEFVQDIPDHGAAARIYPLSHNITTAASHAGYFTAACGVTVFTGTSLPGTYSGNTFTCDPAANLIHRDVLAPNGATFTAKRAFETNEFLASPDNWFRPVNLANGPDGALYICDMYRKTIEHPDYLPEATRKITDFESGKDKGRIYRVVANSKRKDALPFPNLSKFSTKELCLELSSPEGWRRMTAHRLLLERRSPDAVPLLKAISRVGKSPEARVHALRLLEAHGALDDAEINRAMTDQKAPVREHALQLAEGRLAERPALLERAMELAKDPDARVRFQCAVSLGEANSAKIVPALVTIAARDAEDRWTRAAVLSSLGNNSQAFLQQITPIVKGQARNAEQLTLILPLMGELGRILGTDTTQQPLALLKEITRSEEKKDIPWQIALVGGLADGLRSSRTNQAEAQSALMSIASSDSSTTPQRLATILRQASEVASDSAQPVPQRLAAANLLAHADYALAGEPLQKLINPQEPNELQIAAIRALSQMSDPNAAAALIKRDHWMSYTQPVKDAVLAAILAQPRLTTELLAAIEREDIAAQSINPEKRNQLMKHKDEAIRNRATALFENLKPGDRMKIYEDYKAILALKRNSSNGHKIFSQACASCHTFSGEGHAVGPDLTGIRSQPHDALLLHIIVPEYEIMPIYTQYNVETKDGRSVSGVLGSETASSITLKQALGIEETIPRANIASMTSSALSLMPQELEKAMSQQDLADLIGFLKGE